MTSVGTGLARHVPLSGKCVVGFSRPAHTYRRVPAPDDSDDSALLRQYVENQSDDAFAALVGRHVGLVYAVALRSVGDRHRAEEVAQAVFLTLAKKAGQLRHEQALASWLFQTTRWTAHNHVRSEIRRQRREQEAHMQTMRETPTDDLWPKLAALLDDAVAGLNETDRRAIVLRFDEGRSLRDVGAALGASEDAAEKRVSRAVEKLRALFAQRGVAVGAGGLTTAIAAHAAPVAPAGLAATISSAVTLSGTALTAGVTATALKTVAMTTLQKALLTTALVVATGVGLYEARQAAALRSQVALLRQQLARSEEAKPAASAPAPAPLPRRSLRLDGGRFGRLPAIPRRPARRRLSGRGRPQPHPRGCEPALRGQTAGHPPNSPEVRVLEGRRFHPDRTGPRRLAPDAGGQRGTRCRPTRFRLGARSQAPCEADADHRLDAGLPWRRA
jgi:RNA polymerase sigma factor (sigma-70 family)